MMASQFRSRGCSVFGLLLLLALPLPAQVQVGDNLNLNLNGIMSAGYNGVYGNLINSTFTNYTIYKYGTPDKNGDMIAWMYGFDGIIHM